MKYLRIRDVKNRYLNHRMEANNYSRKSILYNFEFSFYDIMFYYDIIIETTLLLKTNQLHNRCLLTNRSRAILNFCKLSRIKFRDLARSGKLQGIRKSSW